MEAILTQPVTMPLWVAGLFVIGLIIAIKR